VICVDSPVPRAWTDAELDALIELGEALGAALGYAQARAELRSSHDFLDAVINAVPHGLYVKDMAGRWLLANDGLCRIMAVDRAQLIGHTNREIFRPGKAAVLDAEDAAAHARGDVIIYEREGLGPAELHGWTLKSKAPITLPDGRRFLVCASVVITGQKEVQVAALAASRRLAMLNGVASAITRGEPLATVVRIAVDELARTESGVSVVFAVREGQTFRVTHAAGPALGRAGVGRRLPARSGRCRMDPAHAWRGLRGQRRDGPAGVDERRRAVPPGGRGCRAARADPLRR
jgi:GAF domain-containing protein